MSIPDYWSPSRTTGDTPEDSSSISEEYRTTGTTPEDPLKEIYTHRTTDGLDWTTSAGRDQWDFMNNG